MMYQLHVSAVSQLAIIRLEYNVARPSPREPTQLTSNWTYYADTVNTSISNASLTTRPVFVNEIPPFLYSH